jgi:hypothetical protein
MAGQERLGRQTPSERQRLLRLGRQTSSDGARLPIIPSAPVRLTGDTQTPSGMRRRPSTLPVDPARSSESTEPAFHIDVDDDADTRLYCPRSDPTMPMGGKRNSSGFLARSDRPSKRPGIVSRPGALILIPADVPSVRVRADSDIDLMIVTHPSGAPYPEPEARRVSFAVKLLVMVIVVAVLLFVAHEVAVALHLPWLDSKRLLEKLPSLRLLQLLRVRL